MLRSLLIASAASAAVLSACQTVETTKAGTVGVDRPQQMMVSSERVDASARKAYAEMMAEARKKGALNRDPAQVQRVRNLLGRVIPQTAAFRGDAPKWQWEINVISSKEINAWCMPGGKMAVYTGLIERLQASDAELAAVVGHEIAHALREHSRERISREMGTQLAVGVASAVLGFGQTGADLANMVANVTLNLPNSREHEVEADRVGVELAARAGYDPHAAISLWEKMQKAGGGQPPQFLSTHPSHESRINDLRVYAERVMPLYQASKSSASAGQ